MKRIMLLLMGVILLAPIIMAEQTVTYESQGAGLMKNNFGGPAVNKATELIVKGDINYGDLFYIAKEFRNLYTLNLAEATIVMSKGRSYILYPDIDLDKEDITARILYLPNTLETVGGTLNPFAGFLFYNLEWVEISEENQYLKTVDGVLFNKAGTILYGVPPQYRQTTYEIPDGVKTIFGGAFWNTKLQYISYHPSLEEIRSGEILGVHYGKNGVYYERPVPTFGRELVSFRKLDGEAVDTGNRYDWISGKIYEEDYGHKDYLYMFYDASKLKVFDFPDFIENIEDWSCVGFGKDPWILNPPHPESVRLPKYVKTASLNLGYVKEFEIPEYLESIDNLRLDLTTTKLSVNPKNKFYRTLEDGVICKDDALIYCPFDKSGGYKVPDDIKVIGYDAFGRRSGITSIDMPSVERIGDNAFVGVNLTDLTTPNVTYIGNFAFEGATLKNVVLPKIETIGDYAFRNADINNIQLDRLKKFYYMDYYNSKIKHLKLLSATYLSFTDEPEIENIALGSSSLQISGLSGFAKIPNVYIPLETPPLVKYEEDEEGSFKKEEISENHCNLYVPVGSKEKYMTHPFWGYYNIVEFDFGGVGETLASDKTDEVKVAVTDGGIKIECGDTQVETSVYTASGQLAYRGYDSEIKLSDGFYIVKVGTAAVRKVIVR